MKKVLQSAVLGLFVVLGLSLAVSSCKKETPPKAEITVIDSTGIAVNEARVILYCVQRPEETRECVISDTAFTDDVGKVSFEFKDPAVLKVDIWKEDVIEVDTGTFPNIGTIRVGDTLCTEGFITLEMNETIEQRYIVDFCNADL